MANLSVVEAQRWIRYTAEAYANPGQFATPQDYLVALTECLDELCYLADRKPPSEEELLRAFSD